MLFLVKLVKIFIQIQYMLSLNHCITIKKIKEKQNASAVEYYIISEVLRIRGDWNVATCLQDFVIKSVAI